MIILVNLQENQEEDIEDQKEIFEDTENILNKALKIVQEQHLTSNVIWAKSVNKNLDGIQKMVNEIESYNNRITNPRTWKDHTNNCSLNEDFLIFLM